MKTTVVIGAGPAGMMAALEAANSTQVILVEANEKLGKKLYITGKGRCNITNAKDISEFFDFIPGNPSFLYSALYSFTNQNTIDLLENAGVKLKVERGGRVFPESDKSSDIINAFQRELGKKHVEIKFKSRVKELVKINNKIDYIVLDNQEKLYGDYFILCTGGKSYPLTGSTGEGLIFAKVLGHNIIPLRPSLVPIEVMEEWVKDLQGLSLKNVDFKIYKNQKKVFNEFGEMLFTHFGISGPIVLSGSRVVEKGIPMYAEIDLKPALTEEELDKRIQRDFEEFKNRDLKNALNELLPQRMISIIICTSGIPEDKKVHSITRQERRSLVQAIKHFRLTIKGLRPIEEAIVTAGGVDTKEIDPSTMQSKLIENLFFAGEIMDVDAYTGGYNIQIALSTGYLAGKAVCEEEKL